MRGVRFFTRLRSAKVWAASGRLEAMQTVEYVRGRSADVFGEAGHPTVLLWHGKQPNARAVLGPLAEQVAGHGLDVVVPDWDSAADDGGRADLLRSFHFARHREADPAGLVLVGWSLGGVAAAGLTVHARERNVHLAHTVCLAGAFMVADPISGKKPVTELSSSRPAPFTLLHGVADDVVPIGASRDFAASLERSGWPVELIELDADHATIAGAGYDPVADRYLPGTDPQSRAVAADVAARIAAVVGR